MIVCALNSISWPVGLQCSECGHPGLVHPGAGGNIEACLFCWIAAMAEALHSARDEVAEAVEVARKAFPK